MLTAIIFFLFHSSHGLKCFVSLTAMCNNIIKNNLQDHFSAKCQFDSGDRRYFFILSLSKASFIQHLLYAWYWTKCGWWRGGLVFVFNKLTLVLACVSYVKQTSQVTKWWCSKNLRSLSQGRIGWKCHKKKTYSIGDHSDWEIQNREIISRRDWARESLQEVSF